MKPKQNTYKPTNKRNVNYKNLPSKTDIRDFFNYNISQSYIVNKVSINKKQVLLMCTMKKEKTLLTPSFYQKLLLVDFISNKIIIEINEEHFQHLDDIIRKELTHKKN